MNFHYRRRYNTQVAKPDLTPDEFGAAVAAVTSAFGDPTRRDIYLFVRTSDDGVKAAEIAEHFALHPNVARHHLEKLAAGGYLDVELARHSSAGRPSKCYRASANDTQLSFPPRRDELLATLLARALERLPVDEARTLAEEVGHEYGRSIAARMEPTEGHRSVKAAVASVADALTAHGFAAHSEARGNMLTLVSEHCPFGEAAQRWPHILCAVDTGMVKGMLEGLYGETQPQLTESRPDGGDHCVTRV
jgi:predicted ArsR family transcriptional regulator